MADLVSVADGLHPQDDYSFLPPSVVAWAGYVGKPEVGAWARPDVARLEATGRLWIPVWTPGDGVTYTQDEARADADAMLAGLAALGIADQRWVFLDIERSRWGPTPGPTTIAAQLWCERMNLGGWPRAGWYGPWQSIADWRARWTGVPPLTLPTGCLGVQYDHALANDRYDISRFNPSILDRRSPVSLNGPEHWDAADWAAVRANLPALADYDPTHADNPSVATVLHVLEGIRDGAAGFDSLPRDVAEILTAVKAIQPGGPAPTYKGTVELTAGP